LPPSSDDKNRDLEIPTSRKEAAAIAKLSFMGVQANGHAACKDLAGGGFQDHELADLIPYPLRRKATLGSS